MKTQGRELCFGEFYSFLTTNYPHMDVKDKRPYKTLMRYYRERNYVFQYPYEAGDKLLLIKRHQKSGSATGRLVSLSDLLGDAAEWARQAERGAATSYRRQCAEEDREEIALLQERWDAGKFAYRRKASCPPKNVINIFGDKTTKEMEKYAEKVTSSFDEDALDMEA